MRKGELWKPSPNVFYHRRQALKVTFAMKPLLKDKDIMIILPMGEKPTEELRAVSADCHNQSPNIRGLRRARSKLGLNQLLKHNLQPRMAKRYSTRRFHHGIRQMRQMFSGHLRRRLALRPKMVKTPTTNASSTLQSLPQTFFLFSKNALQPKDDKSQRTLSLQVWAFAKQLHPLTLLFLV